MQRVSETCESEISAFALLAPQVSSKPNFLVTCDKRIGVTVSDLQRNAEQH